MSHPHTLAEITRLLLGRLSIPESGTLVIEGVCSSSNSPCTNKIFVALKGTRHDGHDFIESVMAAGAAAVLVSDESRAGTYPAIIVSDTHKALSKLAALFADYAAHDMQLVGVTGTNGKTTTNWIVHQLLCQLQEGSIRIGTLGVSIEKKGQAPILVEEGQLTTPDPISIHQWLREARLQGIKSGVLEASSHALDQARIDDVPFKVGIFTNLTRDHLDYHIDMEGYYLAKRRLFELMSKANDGNNAAVINIDDEYGKRMYSEISSYGLRNFTYGFSEGATVKICDLAHQSNQLCFQLRYAGASYQVASMLMGRHNALNLAAAFATGVALGLETSKVLAALQSITQVPGRLQYCKGPGFGVFVDFAHSPDALENVLKTTREIVSGQLWVVFGCGGDRDRGKRPQMAAVARALADRVVVTSDNPRTEDPHAIIADILSQGIDADLVEVDRGRAIDQTLRRAKSGDVVVIAGKGHEDYQIVGTVRHHFSDLEQVQKVLKRIERAAGN